MFITLLMATFILSLIVSFIVAAIFKKPIKKILSRLIEDSISSAWMKYLTFALYVVGISSGVNISKLSTYIENGENKVVELTFNAWVLEIYSNIIRTLQGIAWMLLVFFLFALVAYVIIRLSEIKHKTE